MPNTAAQTSNADRGTKPRPLSDSAGASSHELPGPSPNVLSAPCLIAKSQGPRLRESDRSGSSSRTSQARLRCEPGFRSAQLSGRITSGRLQGYRHSSAAGRPQRVRAGGGSSSLDESTAPALRCTSRRAETRGARLMPEAVLRELVKVRSVPLGPVRLKCWCLVRRAPAWCRPRS